MLRFISGYRGSPLGGVDQAFWAARKCSNHGTSSSSPASMKIWQQPPSGARSRSISSRREIRRRLRHVVRQRVRAWTAAATFSAMPMPPAVRRMVACWSLPATTTTPSHRPCHTRPTTCSGLDDAGALSGQRSGISRLRAAAGR